MILCTEIHKHTQRKGERARGRRERERERERRFIRVVRLRLREEVGRDGGSRVVVQVTVLGVLAGLQDTLES